MGWGFLSHVGHEIRTYAGSVAEGYLQGGTAGAIAGATATHYYNPPPAPTDTQATGVISVPTAYQSRYATPTGYGGGMLPPPKSGGSSLMLYVGLAIAGVVLVVFLRKR